MKLIKQYSIDILIDTDDPIEYYIDENEISRVLDGAGYTVIGSAWKATWDEEGYKTGRPLYSD